MRGRIVGFVAATLMAASFTSGAGVAHAAKNLCAGATVQHPLVLANTPVGAMPCVPVFPDDWYQFERHGCPTVDEIGLKVCYKVEVWLPLP
jgi:hypothetical protein